MDACDPTIQLCDEAVPMDLPVNGTNSTTSFLSTASKVGLPLVGALQLGAGVMTLLGSAEDSSDDWLTYQSYINVGFGTAGALLGVLGFLGNKAPKEEEVPEEEAPAEGEEPMLRQAEEDEAVEGEVEEEALVEDKAPGMTLATLFSLLGLVSGGSTLGLYFVADDKDYTDTEKYLNLAASGLAIVLGTVTLLDVLGSKPEKPEEVPEEPVAEEEPAAFL